LTPDQRFTVLMVVLTAVLGGVGWLAKSVLGVTQQWARTGVKIEELTSDIRDLVSSKERDHARLERAIERTDQRVERHEVWHQGNSH
jgi:hypothetical protein